MKKLITKLVVVSVLLAICLPAYGEILIYKVSGRADAVVSHQLVKSKVSGYLIVDVNFTAGTIDNSALILYGKDDAGAKVHQTILDVYTPLVTNAMVAAEVTFQGCNAIVTGKTKAQDIGNGDQTIARGLKGSLLLDGYLPLSNSTGYGYGTLNARLDTRQTKTANYGGSWTFAQALANIILAKLTPKGSTETDYGDTTAPTPDPMTFATAPAAVDDTQITMTATTATDVTATVMYYFTNLTVFTHDSGWQTSTTYTDTLLDPNTQYCYKVKAKDGAGNRTADSNQACATTDDTWDTTKPTPDPMTWESEPNAQGLDDSITMTATTATDSAGVEYYFTNDTVTGHDSGWQDDPNHEDDGLDPNTQYCYTVKARDKSAQNNTTDDSNSACATTATLDVNAPEPDPMTFATAPAAVSDSEIAMIATDACDASLPILYYFTCFTDGDFNSLWQSDPCYTATGLAPDTLYKFNVRAKDSKGLTTVPSPNSTATTDVDATKPSPDPMTFETAPYAVGPTAITMKATPATDASAVTYQFYYTAGPLAGTQARTWGDANFPDTGLTQGTTYGYKVRARDTLLNTTDWSTSQTAATPLTITTRITEAFNTRAAGYPPVTVTVPAGTYTENLSIGEPNLTLQSAGGKDVTTIQQLAAGFVIEVAGTAHGFTLGGSSGHGFNVVTDPTNAGFMVQLTSGPDNVEFSYNDFNGVGLTPQIISVGAGGADDLTISYNTMILDGAKKVAVDMWGPMNDLLVNNNTFIGSDDLTYLGGSVTFYECPVEGVIIRDNTMTGYVTSVMRIGVSDMNDILYSGNTFDGCGIIAEEDAADPGGQVKNLTVTGNTFGTGSPTYMAGFGFVIFSNCEAADIDWATVQLRNNTFQVRDRLGGALYHEACDNMVAGSGPLDARWNYWNAADGPGDGLPAGDGCGSGDSVSVDVTYEPFWTNAAMTTDANCP